MRCIIAGSRTITSYDLDKTIKNSCFNPSVIISGGARGVDSLGEEWADRNKVPVELFVPDWDTYGKAAGYKRNEKMAENAEALIAIWDGNSKGTKHMIDIATKKGLKVYVVCFVEPFA